MTQGRFDVQATRRSVDRRTTTYRRVAAAVLAVTAVASFAVSRTGHAAAATTTQTRLPVAQIREMNYYPRSGGWAAMWTNFQPSQIDADFGVIAALHANTVRLILDAPTFWNSQVRMMNELQWTVGDASSHGLSVQLTLFDGLNGQWWPSIGLSQAWVNLVVTPFAGDPRVAIIELKNEVPWPQDVAAVAWAKSMVPYIQKVDSGIPVAVSLALNDPDLAANWLRLQRQALAPVTPDVWDIHYYGAASGAQQTFSAARAVASPQPLLIGETGSATDGTAASEQVQNVYLWQVSVAAAKAGLPAPAVWMLYDITGVETYGLYRYDGSAKPAAATMSWVYANWP